MYIYKLSILFMPWWFWDCDLANACKLKLIYLAKLSAYTGFRANDKFDCSVRNIFIYHEEYVVYSQWREVEEKF